MIKRGSNRFSFTLVELMLAVGISMAVIAAGMVIFILLYRTSNDASKQIRVQRKADLLIERLARGPYGGYGGIRGAYVNSQLAGNALPNPVGGTVNPLVGSNVHQTLTYYAQTNFANYVHLATPVTSLANFLTQHSTNAALYTVGYDSTNRWIYYSVNGGTVQPMVDLEDIDLDYMRFSGGLFQLNITPTSVSTNTYSGTNYISTNASNLIVMEFGMPYWTSDGTRRITNHYSAKVYIRNNF
jgi:Tfp pilus assembly protein PilW